MNVLAMANENPEALNTVYNSTLGDRTTLNDLSASLKKYLSVFDPVISEVQTVYGPNRTGDIPHSLASIDKARKLLGYKPEFSMQQGLEQAVAWYWENLK